MREKVSEEASYMAIPRPTAATNTKAPALLDMAVAAAAGLEELLVGDSDSSLEVKEEEPVVVVVEDVAATVLAPTVLAQ
jgi:hypothetical protein